MAFKTSLTAVRYYTAADPYYYTVDNRPITDLHDRDDAIADELDRRTLTVDISGAVSPTTNKLPTGWSINRTGAGIYEITHNLGTASFIVTGNIFGAIPGVVTTTTQSSTLFTVKTVDLAGAPTDFRFQCLVTSY